MTKNRFKSTIVILSLLFAFTSCGGGHKHSAEAHEEELPEDIVELRDDQIAMAQIEFGAIEQRQMSTTIKANGTVTVAPQNKATVSMPMGGFVTSTEIIPGKTVRKGQTLAVIENPEFIDIQQNYLETKIRYELAKAEYERQNELFKSDVSSQKNMQQVTSEYNTLRVQLKALEQKLSLVGIDPHKLTEDNMSKSVALVSPIAGNVTAVNLSIGKYVSPSDVLIEIVNSDKLYLELVLFEKEAGKISNGEKILFNINNESEQHSAYIFQTAKSVDTDKTYKVYADIQDTCENLFPGMYVNASIAVNSNTLTALPSASIVSFDDKDYIFVYEKDKLESGKPFTEYRMIEIQKGVSEDGYTEIILPENFKIEEAKVVVKGAYNLLSAKKNAGEMSC